MNARRCLLVSMCLLGVVTPAAAQSTTYHLHNEVSALGSTKRQLKPSGPDAAAVTIQSTNLRGSSNNAVIGVEEFETQTGVPSANGVIPAGAVATFRVWMRKTANYGELYPDVVLFRNNYAGPGSAFVCGFTRSTSGGPITTTLQLFTLTCTVPSAVTMMPSDRFYLEVRTWLAQSPGNRNVYVELRVEGTLDGNYDSRVTIPDVLPPPTITNLDPPSGPVNWPVTITGTNFGTQGTVTFNGTAATPTNWTSTSINTTVPAGATTGPVVVTVGGAASNGVTFTVIPPPTLISLTPPSAHITDPVTIAGTNFLDTQSSSTVSFNGTLANPSTWSNTSIVVPVPAGATSGNVIVTVSGQASNGLPFTVIPPPTLVSVTPLSAHIGESVTLAGTNFGAGQGTNTVTFNGTPAVPTIWSDTSITTPVPVGARSGNIVVTVSNQPSNGLPFTVILPGTVAGSITRATGGTGISGATVQALLTGLVKGSATSAADGTYSIPNLDPNTYDVRVFASGFSNELRQGIEVSAETTTTLDVPMYVPGAVSGHVTQADGITPIIGAAVTVYAGSIEKGSASTDGSGDYTVGALHPGGYTVQAANVGFRTAEQGAVVDENATTTRNFSLDAAPSGPVLYAYDELGRLVQVTDPAGESAIYRYDAVGNILAIERPGANGVAISAFTPLSGVVGTPVTIYGSGFATIPADNTVTFNGTAAVVTTATATQIGMTVPAGATTGTIAVTTPTGSATSSTSFTVLTNTGVPTITDFAPATAASGTPLSVNGSNFETVVGNNNLRVNLSPAQVTSATPTAIQGIVPPPATTGRVSVSTQNGTAISSDYLWVAPLPYAATDVTSTNLVTFAAATPVSVPTANKIALLAFEGTVDHRVSVNVTDASGGTCVVGLYDPFGSVTRSTPVLSSAFIDVVDLRSTATYSIVFDPQTINPSGATLTVYDVPSDFSSAIGFGGSGVNVQTTVPGQNGRLTFTGAVGQRVSATQVGFNCFTATTSILAPNGGTIASTCGGSFIDVTNPFTAAGVYTILFDPKGANYGSTTITLYDVPADFTGAITPGGPPVAVPTTVPGQNGRLTFNATAGQRIALGQDGYNCFTSTTKILKPDGSELVSTCGGTFIDLQVLNPAGQYTILVDPKDATYGTTTLTLYDVPPEASGSVTINGPGYTLDMTAIAQNGFVTFSGTQGQQARVHISGNTVSGFLDVSLVQLLPGGGETVLASTTGLSTEFDLPAQTLPATGDYKVVVSPRGTATGSATVSVLNP